MEPGELAALLAAAAVHELGHLAAIWLLGLRIRQIRAELTGLCILYAGESDPVTNAAVAAAGPFFGAGLTVLGLLAAERTGHVWFHRLAAMSGALTVCNFLPVSPLDGGRIGESFFCALLGTARGLRISAAVGMSVSVSLVLLGGLLMAGGRGWTVFFFGAALLIRQFC